MQISARNQLRGRVTEIKKGQVAASVKVDVGGGNVVTSTITVESVEHLGLSEGDEVTAVIKASDVMVSTE